MKIFSEKLNQYLKYPLYTAATIILIKFILAIINFRIDSQKFNIETRSFYDVIFMAMSGIIYYVSKLT